MSLGVYMDVHIPKAITYGLRRRGVDVLTAQEDGTTRAADSVLLDRASELGRILFTHDADFLREASQRVKNKIDFAGIVYVHRSNAPVGPCIDDIELIAKTFEAVDIANRIEYIPY